MTNVFHKTWRGLLRIIAGRDTLLATPNHPFYLPGSGRYLPADSLRRGMQLLALTGALLTVQSVAAVDTTVSVYNFEVAEHHNYYVGEEGVLVHNDCVFVKLGLRNLPQQTPAHPIFDVFTNVFGTTPQATLNRMQFLEDYGRLSGQARADFESFFRADDLLGANPGITHEALLAARGNRARAWGVFASSNNEGLRGLRTNVSDIEILGNYFGRHPEKIDLIRIGLESAINKRGYLDWVKHVDTDLEEYHFVFRDWEYGSNKLAWSEYFENLKNSPNFDPFPYEQTIEDLLQSVYYSQLRKSEGYAIFSYTTIFYQKKFDRWLRDGINPEMTNPIANLLTSALDKMPVVPANINYYRGINLSGEDLSTFLARHAEGADVTYQDFTSAANNVADSFLEGSNIRITILPKEGSAGRTIYDFSFGKFQLGTSDEAVFKSGFRFNVESVNPLGNDVYEFIFREL